MLGLKAWVWPVVLCVCPAVPAQCKAPPELDAKVQRSGDAATYAELGTWFGEQGQFACANQAFRSSLALDPQSVKVNYFLGFSLYSSGDKQGALAPLERSAALDANALQPRLLLGAILTELNRSREAEAQWKAALAIDPTSAEALDGLAKQLISEHDYFAAIALLRTALADEDLTLDLASAYGLSGELEEAEASVRQALAADPASIRLTKALATVYVHQHRYQDAAALMRRFSAAHPEDQQAKIQYLSALVLTNDWATARPLGEGLLKQAPQDFQVLYLNGIIERQDEEFAKARDHLEQAVALEPNDYTARYNLGAVLAQVGDAKQAKEQLERAIMLDPSQAEARFQLAGVLRSLGDTSGAQQEIGKYQQLKRASAARAQADTKAQQAREKLASGDVARAVELYREAVSATPDNALLQYRFALALDQAKSFAEERTALEMATKLDPSFALAANQLGYVAFHAGDTATAEVNFRRAVVDAPGFTEAWINLAATLAQESHFSEAQEAVTTALKLDPKNAQALTLSEQLATAAHP